MSTIRHAFDVKVGYSDHTLGLNVPIAAAALGATVIEKHFTLDRNLPGPDHKASLEPEELKDMVAAIRNIEIALGDGLKKPVAAELVNMSSARRSIVARKPIAKGEKFTELNIAAKRPGTGLSPMLWDQVIGQHSTREFEQDELIEL
jgi:N,N'-diacetyllegionaminate synthase